MCTAQIILQPIPFKSDRLLGVQISIHAGTAVADCFDMFNGHGQNAVLKVMLVDEYPDRAANVREALTRAGCEVVSTLTSAIELYDRVRESSPDVIIIDTESPSRDVLEHITFISRDQPRPIVMFSGDRGSETIRLAVRAGVTAYIVDGLSDARIQPILSVAVERFEAEQELKRELSASKSMLAERKAIERAKGLIMKQASCDEETAFRHLRKFAMDRGVKMIDAAKTVIAMGSVAPNNSA
jgi:two-component system, response regulator / RNA-binding antiterminator